jgi:hypothetical protein
MMKVLSLGSDVYYPISELHKYSNLEDASLGRCEVMEGQTLKIKIESSDTHWWETQQRDHSDKLSLLPPF